MQNSDFDSKALRLFVQVARQGSLTGASQRCNMSVSAASRALGRLENSIGCKLLLRDGRGLRLTSQGETVLSYAAEVLQGWEDVQAKVEVLSQQPSGRLSLYCSVTAAYGVLPNVLPKVQKRYPDIELRVHTGDQAEAIPRVLAREEDLAIAALPEQLPPTLAATSLMHSPLRFIVPKNGTLAQRISVLDWHSQWSSFPYVLVETGVARDIIDRLFLKAAVQPDIYAQVTGHEAVVSLVALGYGVGVVPEVVLSNSPQQDRVTVLEGGPVLPTFNICLVALASRLKDPLLSALWQLY